MMYDDTWTEKVKETNGWINGIAFKWVSDLLDNIVQLQFKKILVSVYQMVDLQKERKRERERDKKEGTYFWKLYSCMFVIEDVFVQVKMYQ